ncbi:transcriptional regulator [Dermacoccus sp. PE3]|uniref:TetR/AcrR family transcriptional regulator n=1 Tax=Dermacoccus sp. PE3 TaxID=1641401 RepID=UPI000641CF17|nr:TetR/AcrR family transcriptional regulator [Dermacoccus sp. PE3]KLO63186.1 transcriptional regulator [Dermacoccus sp. PE3]
MKAEDIPSEALSPPPLTAGARRIVDAASELFYRYGIHAVGVDTIAAKSGVTKRTLYDRFGSKDQLIAVYLQLRHHRWWERMERRVEQQPESAVLAFFDSYFEDAEASDRGCAFINAAAELSANHPARRVVRAHKRAVLDRLAELLTTETGSREEAIAIAEEIYLLLEGAITHHGIDDDTRLVTRAREITARLIHDHAPHRSAHA